MTLTKTQIIAMGGSALPPELDNLRLIEYFLLRAVSAVPGARAWHVRKSGRSAAEKAIPTKLIRAR